MRKIILFVLISTLVFTGCTNAEDKKSDANPSKSGAPTPIVSDTSTKVPTKAIIESGNTPTSNPSAAPEATMSEKPTTTPEPPKTDTTKTETTIEPTKQAEVAPSKRPTPTPTKATVTPTKKPTATPTKKPKPTATKKPTAVPTNKPTAVPSKIDPTYFSRYNVDMRYIVKSVDSDVILLKETIGYIKELYGKDMVWSQYCQDRAIAVARGDVPKKDGSLESDFQSNSQFSLQYLTQTSYVWMELDKANSDRTEFAMVAIEFTDKWDNKLIRYVCVAN